LTNWLRPDPLEDLGRSLHGTVPAPVAELFDDFVGHGEGTLALEQLFDDLDDQAVRIPEWLATKIVAAAQEYGVTRFSPEQVYALVDG